MPYNARILIPVCFLPALSNTIIQIKKICAQQNFLYRIKNSSRETAVEINLRDTFVYRHIFSASFNFSSPVKTLDDRQCCLLVVNLLLPPSALSIVAIKIKKFVQSNSEHKVCAKIKEELVSD